MNPITLRRLAQRALLATMASGAVAAVLTSDLTPARADNSTPDLTGVWGRDAHNYPKPYMKGRQIADGFNNEYLKPWVIEALERDNMVTRSGHTVVTAHSVCYPEGVPYVFGGSVIQILQTPTEVTMLFGDTGQMRTIYLNRQHPAHVEPSWFGDSVGHYEGDTLVVDTVGIAVNPESGSMGNYGTPHTEALHVVETYRHLHDGEKSTAPRPKNDTFDADAVIKDGKVLRQTFTLDDPGAYKKPWTVTLDYLPISSRLREYICAENAREPDLAPLIPQTNTPDF